MKKFVCSICGYVYEGPEAPAECPVCHAKKEKFNEQAQEASYATEHVVGSAKGVDAEIFKGLQDNFNGECCEVGMYLAMARVADREGYDIQIIRADMTKPLPFPDESFDMIFHPVSNCYVREVKPIWRECWRILKPGGLLLSGVDHYINYIVDAEEREIINHLPFDPLLNEDQRAQLERDDAGMQFSHSLEEQINGQLEAGFTLVSLYEDTNGEGRLHALNIPTFLAMLSRK